jgi:hypothetical protein
VVDERHELEEGEGGHSPPGDGDGMSPVPWLRPSR